MGIQSLHSHTLLSDGKLSHLEVLKVAERLGIEVVAFTDHDFLPDEKILKQLRDYKGPVRWLIGIETSAGLPKELGGGINGPHVVGLFTDPTNKALQSYCKKTQETRIERMRNTVKNFQILGFDITEQDCLKFTTGASVGQPHIVEALKSKPKNIKLIDEYVKKMAKEAETDPKVKEQYEYMKQRSDRQIPYILFLNDDAFVPGIKAPYGYFEDLDSCVNLIRQAGGLAVVAHYSYSRKELPLEVIEKMLKENRLDGMEIIYGLESLNTDSKDLFESDKQKIKAMLKKYHKIATGGSDAHKKEDFERYVEAKDFSAESNGMVEKIIDQTEVSLKWSNLVYGK